MCTVGGTSSELTVRVLLSPPQVELASRERRRSTFQLLRGPPWILMKPEFISMDGVRNSPTKNHTPTPNLKIREVFFIWRIALKGWVSVFQWLCLHCRRMPLHVVLTADLTMSPPASSAAAPSVESRNNGSANSRFSTSSSNEADLMKSAMLTYSICLALVTFLPTALTKLTGTNCLEVSAGSAGQMSL